MSERDWYKMYTFRNQIGYSLVQWYNGQNAWTKENFDLLKKKASQKKMKTMESVPLKIFPIPYFVSSLHPPHSKWFVLTLLAEIDLRPLIHYPAAE